MAEILFLFASIALHLINSVSVALFSAPIGAYYNTGRTFHTLPSQILFDGICDNGLDKEIRKEILDSIKDEKHYEIACNVLNQAGRAYFELGLKTWATLK